MLEKISISSWDQFNTVVNQFDLVLPPVTNYIYRGHSDSKWRLSSTFHRIVRNHNFSWKQLIKLEKDATEVFQEEAHSFLSHSELPKLGDAPDWWNIMQHHGAPTRLLDWTRSPYIAAYYACESNFDKPGIVWVLHPTTLRESLKKLHGEDIFSRFRFTDRVSQFKEDAPPLIDFIKRNIKTERMIAQQSIFTACLNIGYDQDEVISSALEPLIEKVRFLKLIIPAQLKIVFLRKLRIMNITGSSLFKGIDGVGRSTKEQVIINIPINTEGSGQT